MLFHLVGGRKYKLEAEIDKINTGDSYDYLPGDHHTSTDDAIEKID
jgi:hypothetical protein